MLECNNNQPSAMICIRINSELFDSDSNMSDINIIGTLKKFRYYIALVRHIKFRLESCQLVIIPGIKICVIYRDNVDLDEYSNHDKHIGIIDAESNVFANGEHVDRDEVQLGFNDMREIKKHIDSIIFVQSFSEVACN